MRNLAIGPDLDPRNPITKDLKIIGSGPSMQLPRLGCPNPIGKDAILFEHSNDSGRRQQLPGSTQVPVVEEGKMGSLRLRIGVLRCRMCLCSKRSPWSRQGVLGACRVVRRT